MKVRILGIGLLFCLPTLAVDLTAFGVTAGSVSGTPQILISRGPGQQLKVVLPINETRLVHFPTPVSLTFPQDQIDGLSQSSTGSTAYFTATKPFPATVMTAQSLYSDSEVYHFLLSASEGAPTVPLQIMHLDEKEIPKPEFSEKELISVSAASSNVPTIPVEAALEVAPNASPPGYPEMLRHAAQTLYAPKRLRPSTPGINLVPIKSQPLAVIRGGMVVAKTHAQWRAGRFWLTAVVLENQLQESLWVNTADPPPTAMAVLRDEDIRGDWRVYGFQHSELKARGARDRSGRRQDVTTMYLIHVAGLYETLEYQP